MTQVHRSGVQRLQHWVWHLVRVGMDGDEQEGAPLLGVELVAWIATVLLLQVSFASAGQAGPAAP